MTEKIRLGLIGANSDHRVWAAQSHLPALVNHPDIELAAVCTTRWESAKASARRYGARKAFIDHREMLADPDVEAVAVVLRVPSHSVPTRDAIKAGKAVFTEWPLGRTTAEAAELAELARARGVRTAVGLQARVNPPLTYLKDLIGQGFLGQVVSCHVSLFRDGILQRSSDKTWQRDAGLGATTFTILNGHAIDTLRFLLGDLRVAGAIVTTEVKNWFETDTEQYVPVTAPDNVIVSGWLPDGGVFSSHVGSIPWSSSGYRCEIYGTEGTLVASAGDSPQLTAVRLMGAKRGNALTDLAVPDQYVHVPSSMPSGPPYYVGQLYHQFARSIRGSDAVLPDFDTAVGLHKLLDVVQSASGGGASHRG